MNYGEMADKRFAKRQLGQTLHPLKINQLKLTDQILDPAVGLWQQYRLSYELLSADALIAATALEHNQPFITKNQRDVRFITGLSLLPSS